MPNTFTSKLFPVEDACHILNWTFNGGMGESYINILYGNVNDNQILCIKKSIKMKMGDFKMFVIWM